MKTPLSPKVVAGFLIGLLITSVATNITLVTPGMLTWLGPFAPFIYGTVATLFATGAAYYKADPLRTAGLASQLNTAAADSTAATGPWMGDGHGSPDTSIPAAPVAAPVTVYTAPATQFPAAAIQAAQDAATPPIPGTTLPAPVTAPAPVAAGNLGL